MRRRKLLLVLAGLAVLLVAGVVMLWPRPSRVTRETFNRIREGMNRAEVEAILGPPGEYTTGPADPYRDLTVWTDSSYAGSGVDPDSGVEPDRDRVMWSGRFPVEGGVATKWESDAAVIDIIFDGQGKVAYTQFTRQKLLQLSPLDRLLWRAKRQWHRRFP